VSGEQGEGPVLTGGVLLRLTAQVQCLQCGAVIVANLENPDPENLDELVSEDIGCKRCTDEAGEPVAIPIVVTVGDQVREYFEPEDGDEGEEDDAGDGSTGDDPEPN
jgi:hypothetical protein